MNAGQQIVIGLSVLLGVAFVLASAYNRRRGVSTFRWLQAGLEAVGKISEARWIGTSGSGARLVVAKAERPFRRVELAFLLESRELLPLWLVNHYLRDRRDYLIFKAELRSVPTGELEILRRGRSRLESLVQARSPNPWQMVAGELPAGLLAAERGRDVGRMLEAIRPWLESHGSALRRLSLARTSPQLILEIDLPSLTPKPGPDFFQSVKEMADGLAAARDSAGEA